MAYHNSGAVQWSGFKVKARIGIGVNSVNAIVNPLIASCCLVLLCVSASPALAGGNEHRVSSSWHVSERHDHRPHRHAPRHYPAPRRYYPERRYYHHSNNAEYLFGGIVLGAALNDAFSSNRTTVVKETVIVGGTPTRTSSLPEYLRDSDGRCYYVQRMEDRRVLTEVDDFACQ